MRGLTDKAVVVLGGATGLGAATAARLAAEGSSVVIGDIAEDAARRTAAEIAEDGGKATAVAADLADAQSIGDVMPAPSQRISADNSGSEPGAASGRIS